MSTLTSFDLSYAGTGFPDHKDDAQYDLVRKVSAKIGGRWDADFETAADVAHFRRRPDLPPKVAHPGLELGRPWHILPIADGVAFDLKVTSHILVIGRTNAGKTALMRSIIAAFCDSAARGQARVRLADPKRVELIGFKDWPGVETIATSDEQLWQLAIDTKAEMELRFALFEQDGIPLESHKPLLLLIDEYEEYVRRMRAFNVTSGQRKSGMEPVALDAMKTVLAMARKGHIHVVIGTQRPDAAWFGGSARDNLQGRAGVGPLSAEAARMLFGTSLYGRDLPMSAKGRTTVQLGDERPFECQAWWTPDPSEPHLSAEDTAILARLSAR